ncbi:MAG TPA: hypothetical protein VGI64_16265 [Streptosporangiaceae bacterium]|jgi:hypothetical protein
MTQIVIRLQRGPDDQPVGALRTGRGADLPFTGWLDLIRLLERELSVADGASGAAGTEPPDAGLPAGTPAPSSGD